MLFVFDSTRVHSHFISFVERRFTIFFFVLGSHFSSRPVMIDWVIGCLGFLVCFLVCV